MCKHLIVSSPFSVIGTRNALKNNEFIHIIYSWPKQLILLAICYSASQQSSQYIHKIWSSQVSSLGMNNPGNYVEVTQLHLTDNLLCNIHRMLPRSVMFPLTTLSEQHIWLMVLQQKKSIYITGHPVVQKIYFSTSAVKRNVHLNTASLLHPLMRRQLLLPPAV